MESNELREKLAERVHVVWQRWMGYMLAHFDEEHLNRWRRQANTKYEDLPEDEKESDRSIADEYIALLTRDVPAVPKEVTAWVLRRLNAKDAATFALWCSTGRPLEEACRDD